jgi:Domain of unknown function (DUF4189)
LLGRHPETKIGTVLMVAKNMRRNSLLLLALTLVTVIATAVAWPRPAIAEGALAVGQPPDIAKSGLAYGYATSRATESVARAQALQRCREPVGSSAAARKLCKVIETFRDQCVAVAIDAESNPPGYGWGIAAGMQAAEDQALAKCEETAGQGGRGGCRIDKSACDTKYGPNPW